jgi:hypothetical protein
VQIVTGILTDVREREAGNPGNTWTERTLVVADFGVTYYLVVGRDFGTLPAKGDNVAIDVSVRPYVRRDGSAGHGLQAIRRNTEAEAGLFGLASAAAR